MNTDAVNPVPALPRLSLNLHAVVALLFFIALFSGFQGGRYFMANRLQELGIASCLALYLLGAWRSAFVLQIEEWRRWVFGPALLIFGIMGVSALVFAWRYGGSVLFSFFSAREFMLGFLAPGVYLLGRTGTPLALWAHITWLAIAALILNYLYFYFTLDLQAAFFSGDHTISNLVTYDEWRGFRLKPPLFAIMIGLLAALKLLAGPGPRKGLLLALLVLALGAYIWSIVQFRATLATMALAVACYPLFLRSKTQISWLLVLTPLGLLCLPAIAWWFTEFFLGADGGNIRAKAYAAGLEHIAGHALLGAGEDSAYGLSYQDIVAPYFYPSDIGLVGVAYKYGLVGTLLYLYMHIRIWAALWRANLQRTDAPRLSPLIWAMLVFMTAQTFNLVLNPGLAYAQGITVGALALALSALALADCD